MITSFLFWYLCGLILCGLGVFITDGVSRLEHLSKGQVTVMVVLALFGPLLLSVLLFMVISALNEALEVYLVNKYGWVWFNESIITVNDDEEDIVA